MPTESAHTGRANDGDILSNSDFNSSNGNAANGQHPPGGARPTSTDIVPDATFSHNSATGLSSDWNGGGGAPVSATGRYAPEGSDSIDLGQMLAIFRRRWKAMLLTFAALFALSFLYLKLSKSVYQATATMQILQNTASPASVVPGLEELADRSDSSMETQVQLIGGGNVRAAAQESLSPAELSGLKGMANVSVEPIGKTNLVAISAKAYNPQSAAALANAIGKKYQEITLLQNQSATGQQVKYVEDQLRKVGKRRNDALDLLRQFKQQTGIISVDQQSSGLSGRLSGGRTALEAAQADRQSAIATLGESNRALAKFPEEKLVPTGVTKNQAVVTLQAELTQLENEKASLSGEYLESSVRMRELQAKIDAIKSSLARESDRTVTSWQPDPARAPIVEQRNKAQADIWALDARIKSLKEQLGNAETEFNKLPRQQLEFVKLEADSQTQDQAYNTLNTTLQGLKIGQQARQPDARLTTPAEVPGAPVSPDRKKILASGFVLGILAAIALALLWDAMDDRLYSEDDVQRATNFPILAQVPHLKVASEQTLLASGDKITPLLESFRMLRANISFCATDRPIKSIVVTSSVPNEGKSSAALNLAIASALGGDKTILLDLDLRRPTQHTFLQMSLSPGFTSVVSGQSTLQEALRDTPIADLQVMTGGPVPPNPFKLLNSHSARQTISELIAMADFVVIDTPPMLGLADARLISSLVDGTVMVVAMQETGRREVGRAGDLLNSTGNDILGVVMTKVPHSAGGYTGYYTYRSYGHYFDENTENVERLQETNEQSKPALIEKK